MLTGKFLLAVIAVTFATTLIQWFFIGFLFHKYQALTPSVWRKESSRSYAASTVIALVFAFLFVTLFFLVIEKAGPLDLVHGIGFGVLLWACFSLTFELNSAIYVNFSRMFTLGKCLSSLVEYAAAGALAAALL
jgi:hypothetical protein